VTDDKPLNRAHDAFRLLTTPQQYAFVAYLLEHIVRRENEALSVLWTLEHRDVALLAAHCIARLAAQINDPGSFREPPPDTYRRGAN
jgi:hypothetical protein